MNYQLSLLATVIIIAAALVIGFASAVFARNGRRRQVWSVFVAALFTVSAMAAVIFEFSWMFDHADLAMAQAGAMGAALTGIVFAFRANA